MRIQAACISIVLLCISSADDSSPNAPKEEAPRIGEAPPKNASPAEETLVLEIQEVETVRRGKEPRFTRKKVHYTIEAEIQPGTPISIQAAVGKRTVTAQGKAGKLEGEAFEISLKGEALEELTGSAVPPGLKGPVYSSRPFAFDGKAEIGKAVLAGVVEDANKVVRIETLLTLKRRKAGE